MNETCEGFVVLPDFLQLNRHKLKHIDALAYASIRSYINSDTDRCHPSYEKIMSRSGMSRSSIADSIKRLEASGYIKVNHSNREGQCNQYDFPDRHRFERVPMELFEAEDLSAYEKGMLLCLRSFFNHGLLTSSFSIKEMAKYLGLTYQQVYKPYRALLDKGYINEVVLVQKGSKKLRKRLTLERLKWPAGFPSNAHKRLQAANQCVSLILS